MKSEKSAHAALAATGTAIGSVATCRATARRTSMVAAGFAAWLAFGFAAWLAIGMGASVAHATAIIEFSTYLGGSNDDSIRDVGTDALGNIYVSGTVGSMNFPGLAASSVTNGGAGLRYVAKLDAQARAVQYVTVVGGGYADLYRDVTEGLQPGDRLEGFAVDASGYAYVAAYATSRDFPASGGVFVRNGARVLYKLDPAGRIAFEYALDPAIRSVRALAVDVAGNVYLAGTAATGLRTTPGVVYPTSAGVGPFLTKIDPAGPNVVYSTYLSQPGQRPFATSTLPPFDRLSTPLAIAVDAAGRVHVTGQATHYFAATPGAVDQGTNQDLQSFVARLNPAASAFDFVARIGGYGTDRGTGIAIAPDGAIVVVGKTLGQSYPTLAGFLNAIQYQAGTMGVYEAGYVVKLATDGKAILAASMIAAGSGSLGGVDGDTTEPAPLRVAIDSDGNIWIAGTTGPPRIVPVVDPLQPAQLGRNDALILKLSPSAGRQLFASTFGGTGDDAALAIAVAPGGGVIVAGKTSSPDFPATNALQGGLGWPSRSDQSNGFITRLGDATTPIALTSATNPANAGQSIDLVAVVAATGAGGNVEFRRAGVLVATMPLAGNGARLSTVLPPGVHAFTATYRGPGIHDGVQSSVFYEVVNPLCN